MSDAPPGSVSVSAWPPGAPRLGLLVGPVSPLGGSTGEAFSDTSVLAVAAANAGFDSVWVAGGPGSGTAGKGPSLLAPWWRGADPFMVASGLAVTTSDIAIGVLGLPAGSRLPAVLAKQATTLDLLAGGRTLLALEPDRSGRQLATDLQTCRRLFSGKPGRAAAGTTGLVAAPNLPRPARPGGPPLYVLVGVGSSDVMLPAAAADADGAIFWGPDEALERVLRHPTTAAPMGVAPRRIAIVRCTLGPPPAVSRAVDVGRRLLDAGADGIIVALAAAPAPHGEEHSMTGVGSPATEAVSVLGSTLAGLSSLAAYRGQRPWAEAVDRARCW